MRRHAHVPSGRLGFLLGLALVLGSPPAAQAVMDATTECLIEFDGVPDALVDGGGTLSCVDCDPTCDGDSPGVANGTCTFVIAGCLNQPRINCPAGTIKSAKVRPRRIAVTPREPCGDPTEVVVKLKRGGKKPGRVVVIAKALTTDRPRRVDVDRLVLMCERRDGACPTTTTVPAATTTTVGATTTTSVAATTTTAPGTTTTSLAGTTTTTSPATTTTSAAPTTTTSAAPTTTTSAAGTTSTSAAPTTTTSAAETTSTSAAPTTTTSAAETTTTTMPGPSCAPILTGQPVTNTYNMVGVLGPKLCHTNASANKFGPCTADSDCGGTMMGCQQTPFITADGITLAFPLGVSATFTVTEGTFPACSHEVCMGCGNPDAACASIPGCVGDPSCSKTTCCDAPRFAVPSFSIPSLAVCVNVDQAACGTGVFNTSDPQTGDNEVDKRGDTSDPGADCTYGTGDDMPAPGKPCSTIGQGADTKGKIVRTVGNGANDAAGIQWRLLAPLLATAWSGDLQGCPADAVFDGINNGELVLTQLLLNAELTTAGVSARFEDMNMDGCALSGAGFSGAGPVTVSPPAVTPMPAGGGPSQAAAAGIALAGGGPLFDTGFVGIVPFAAPTIASADTCSCTVTPGCPE